MASEAYLYRFLDDVPLEEVEAQLLLATAAVESLHGESRTRLDAAHCLDTLKRACMIDASTEVGRHLNQVFAGFLLREFGGNAFEVERVDRSMRPDPPSGHSPFHWN